MCQHIFIGSVRKLPLIAWNDDSPGFYVTDVGEVPVPEAAAGLFRSDFYYELGSYMGCACGLASGEGLLKDDHPKRVSDIGFFADYLISHSSENELKVFVTSFDEFPENYDELIYDPRKIDPESFDPPSDIVWRITQPSERDVAKRA